MTHANALIVSCSQVCLVLLARQARGAEEAAASSATEERKDKDTAKEAVAELLETSESSNNNTAVAEEDDDSGAAEDGAGEKTNSKRTIDHNLGYGYRFNTVLRPVHPVHSMPMHSMHHHAAHHSAHHAMPRRPMFRLQRYPHHHYSSPLSSIGSTYLSSSGSGTGSSGAPFRFSQPLPSPPQHAQVAQAAQAQREEQGATRPVTEAPSGPHSETVSSVYRTLPQDVLSSSSSFGSSASSGPQSFAYEDEPQQSHKTVTMTASIEATSGNQESEQSAEAPGASQVAVQYADDAPSGPTSIAPHSYQQVLQHLQLQQAAEPTYILASAAAAPHMFASSSGSHAASSPLSALYGHGMSASPSAASAHPVMYAATHMGGHMGTHMAGSTATQMIPVIIVRLMDSQTAASLSPAHHAAHHAGHHAAAPYSVVNMQFLRDYLSKLYAPAPQYMAAPADPEPIMYSSPLYSSTQLQKLQLQQQLHAQLQKQLQAQQQRHSVAALLQEQHRQRIASAQQHGRDRDHANQRTEVTVHRSPAMSPQDYKESVEQQEEA